MDGTARLASSQKALEACRARLAAAYHRTRQATESLAAPLSAEDQAVQSMADASPAKWHRGHTTWFFETFVLRPHCQQYAPFDPAFGVLFNSYYELVGPQHPRAQRGLLTRPSCDDVTRYRAHVDTSLQAFIAEADDGDLQACAALIELGVHHEQQHQELMLMDILHAFSCNPTYPRYAEGRPAPIAHAAPLRWIAFPGGDTEIGHNGRGFAFDNESPRHEVKLRPFRLASRPVTNADWLAFMEDGGYRRPALWLADGWAAAQREGWTAPLYWQDAGETRQVFTLRGLQALNTAAAVCHVSFYEADAFARWAGKRLPTEAEWETAAAALPRENRPLGNFLESGAFQPQSIVGDGKGLTHMFGDTWEHTQSPYSAYPGFTPAAGAVGEYNGKFMINQTVLRGGSCVTPETHIRASYRNFFYPHMRWQFAGVRLAEDAA